jgi:hypothetical protein
MRTNLSSVTEMTAAKWISGLAGIGWALFLPAQTFSIILMPTCWLVLAYWGCLLWLTQVRSDSIWRPWLGIGLVIGFVAVFVATILFLWPIAHRSHLFVSWKRGRRRATLGAAGWCCGSPGSGSSCGRIRLRGFTITVVAREPVLLSAHSGLNLWIVTTLLRPDYPRIPPGLRASQEGLLRDSITLARKIAGKE